MKKALRELISAISTSVPSNISPSLITKWQSSIEKLNTKLNPSQKDPLINTLIRAYPSVYITSEAPLSRLIKSLAEDISDARSSCADSLFELGKQLLYNPEDIQSISTLDCQFKHYHLLRYEFRLALKNPLSQRISKIITDIVDNFREKYEQHLSHMIKIDCRIATLLGIIYLSEHQRRILHPKQDLFLQNAKEWFGMSINYNEPCACFYFAQQLEKESESKLKTKLLEIASQHEYPKEAFLVLSSI